jgi:hypothetical protein
MNKDQQKTVDKMLDAMELDTYGEKGLKEIIRQSVVEIVKRSALPKPAPNQEPVAWIIETEIEGKLSEWVCTDKKHYMDEHDAIKDPIPLYTAPPKPEPLSDEYLQQLCERERFAYSISQQLFNAVARRIEKAHGITGVKGNE